MTMQTTKERTLSLEPLREMIEDMERDSRARRVEAARRDPEKHKLCTVFPDGLRWRYWSAGKRADGSRVASCYTTTANAAGYYLTFRETIDADGDGKRDLFVAHKLRRKAKAHALDCSEAWKAEATS